MHWPFCVRKCPYCDFTSRKASSRFMELYLSCLHREIELWAEALPSSKRSVDSVYFGGGTPSTMTPPQLESILSRLREAFRFGEGTEITVEVNPGTWAGSELQEVVHLGVNRLSLGLQSLDGRSLSFLGRIHGPLECRRLLRKALDLDGVTVNVDLIYGLPEELGNSFIESLEEVLDQGPHHVSIYPLTLSPGVPMAKRVERGEIELPGEDRVAGEYERAVEMLGERGYLRYEISNFCLPGKECRHNLGYWRREEYLGLGASAHSFLGGVRISNVDSVLYYIFSIRRSALPVRAVHPLLPGEDDEERLILGLRLEEGVSIDLLRGREDALSEFESLGLIRRDGGRISLTTRGILLQNEVLVRIMSA